MVPLFSTKNLSKDIQPQGGGLSANIYDEIVENNSQKNEIDETTSSNQQEEPEKMMAPDFTMVDKNDTVYNTCTLCRFL